VARTVSPLLLELGWGIFEAKGHDCPSVMMVWNAKHCLVPFFWMDS